jgi:gliding motility-associated-like protein
MEIKNNGNKHAWLLCILLVGVVTSHAQNEANNWFMGTYLGMKFLDGTRQVVPVKTTPMYAPYAAASYSDPQTGELLFYTNGVTVFNKNHKQIPNGYNINGETYSSHAVIVPMDSHKFYIISSSTTSNRGIFYAVVDMRKNDGLGDVVESAKSIIPNADLQFCVVKQLFENGYWLIAHSYRSDEFRCYRLNKDGIDRRAIVSKAGSVSPQWANYNYGKMVSTSDGSRFVFSFGSSNETAKVEAFDFDKVCGSVTFNQSFFAHPLQAVEQIAFPAYSADNNKLYVNWIYNSGQVLLIQYNLSDNFPNSSYVIIKQGTVYSGDMQLGPDGKIYLATSENGAVTGKVSVIQSPEKTGIACSFIEHAFSLAGDPSMYFVEHFPEFVMDTSGSSSKPTRPEMIIQNTCNNQPVSFGLRETLKADSVRWELGDGKIKTTQSFLHQYDTIGNYPISLSWFVCGYQYMILDTLRLRDTPKVQLGNDTTLCDRDQLLLSGPTHGDRYQWNTGDTTFSIQVKGAGIYKLKVWEALCTAEDEIKVDLFPPLFTALGDEYFICDDDQELVKLDAGKDFTQYKWTPTGDTTQWIIVGDVGKYFVVVKDYRGCDGSDGTKVERRCPVSVFYPNAFTPNNDGINDLFLPIGSDVVEFYLVIYNAWGQRVFESRSIEKGWDGKVEGKPAPVGSYIYQSRYSGYRNKKLVAFEANGNVTLMR